MSGKRTGVFGVYPIHDSADAAADSFGTKEFRSSDISVPFPRSAASKEISHEKATRSAEGAVACGGIVAALAGKGASGSAPVLDW